MSIIPTINIAPFYTGSDEAKQAVASQIGQACQEIGFFTISGHPVSQSLLTELSQAAYAFFDLPLAEKNVVQKRTTGKGYMGLGIEHLAASLDKAAISDYKESLNLGLPVDPESWPKNPPQLRTACETYIKTLQKLATDLVELFALALDTPFSTFADKIDRPKMGLRLLDYPPMENPQPGQTRAGEHTDYGILTILWSENSRGLQAQNRAGEWVDVVAAPDEFIINIGDLMMNWTNDRWVSTLHRVVPPVEDLTNRRQSIPFFFNPNPDAIIECLDSCCSPTNPAKYPPVLASKHHNLKKGKSLGET